MLTNASDSIRNNSRRKWSLCWFACSLACVRTQGTFYTTNPINWPERGKEVELQERASGQVNKRSNYAFNTFYVHLTSSCLNLWTRTHIHNHGSTPDPLIVHKHMNDYWCRTTQTITFTHTHNTQITYSHSTKQANTQRGKVFVAMVTSIWG